MWKAKPRGTIDSLPVLDSGAIPLIGEPSWTRRLGAQGGADITVSTFGLELVDQIKKPWENTWEVIWQPEGKSPVTVFAGPLLTSAEDFSSQQLSLAVSPVGALLDRRKLFGLEGGWTYGTRVYNGMSWASIVREAIRDALAAGHDDTRPNWGLPMIIGNVVTGVGSARSERSKFETASEFIERVAGVEEGPDWDIRPVVDADDKLWWEVVAQTPRIYDKESPMDLWIPMPDVEGYTGTPGLKAVQDLDGTREATGLFGIGEGEGDSIKWYGAIAGHTSGRPNLPILNDEVLYPDVTSASELASLTRADLAARRGATSTWSLSVDATALDDIGQTMPGNDIHLQAPACARFPSGMREELYVVGVSGRGTTITPEVQAA